MASPIYCRLIACIFCFFPHLYLFDNIRILNKCYPKLINTFIHIEVIIFTTSTVLFHIIHNKSLIYPHYTHIKNGYPQKNSSFEMKKSLIIILIVDSFCRTLELFRTYSLFTVMSNPGFAFKEKSARFPFSNKTLPTAAIIAALSVHSFSGGITNSISGMA